MFFGVHLFLFLNKSKNPCKKVSFFDKIILMKNLDDSVEEIKETINRRGFVKVPIIEGEEGKESSFRRVAKFLLLIGVDQASKILPLLPQEQIERLMIEIASIRYVDPEEATVILAEFQALSKKHDAIGGIEKAREILEATYGKEKAAYMLEKSVPKQIEEPFTYLNDLDGEKLYFVLKDEALAIKTLVLSKVKPSLAADTIKKMPDEEKKQTILRLAKMQNIDQDTIKRVDFMIKEKVKVIGNTNSEIVDGRGALAEILKRMELKSETAILDSIESADPELSKDLYERLFTKDDVLNADDRYLQEFLHKMSDKEIAILISDKSLEFRGKILSNVSSGRGMNIVDEENLIKPLRKVDVDAATKEFYSKLRNAYEKGDLYVKGRSEDDIYVV